VKVAAQARPSRYRGISQAQQPVATEVGFAELGI
jgi:hypothetical protein